MTLKDKLITLEDLKAVHDVDAGEITGIKADLVDAGLSGVAKRTLLNTLKHMAWVDENGQSYCNVLEGELFGYNDLTSYSVAGGTLLLVEGGFSTGKFANEHRLMRVVNREETPAQAYITNFRLACAKFGEHIYEDNPTLHPIPVPDGAISATASVTPSTSYIRAVPAYWKDGKWYNMPNTWGNIAWGQGSCTINLPVCNERQYLLVYCKHESASNGGTPYPDGEPSNVTVTFGFGNAGG